MTPGAGVNGVLPATVLQKNAPASAPRGPSGRATAPRLKLVLRRLPPGLTKAEFDATLGDDWKVGGGKVDWMLYKPGKVSKDLSKPSRPSRAYLRVTTQNNISALSDFVRQTSFIDATNSARDPALVGPPCLDLAPYPRVPGGRRRNDARQGLIDQDPEFKDFLESLTNPVTKPVPPDPNVEGATHKNEKVTTTPLIEHLREKKTNKDKPPAKAVPKHSRGESREDKTDKGGDKKILSKTGKENTPSSPEKARKLSRAERAAKEAVKVLNKEASAASQNAQSGSASSTDKAAAAPPPPAPERKRERGNASIAAKMLQRDLGISPAANRRRGTKREVTPAVQDTAQKPDETSATKEKPKETSTASSPVEKPPKAPTSPKREFSRPTRAERRAHKASLGDKANQASGDGPKSQNKAPAAPVILKKPPTSTQAPVQSQVEPPKGPAASRAPPAPPTVSSSTKSPIAPAPPTGPAALKTLQPPTTTLSPLPISTSTGRQAFLKHANASQGITEPLIEAALSVFGAIEKVEIDKRKGFAYVDFVESEGLQKAIAGSPVKVAQGAVQVLERKEKVTRRQPAPPTGPARGRGGFAGRGRGRGGGRGGTSVASEGTPGSVAPPATPAPAPASAATPFAGDAAT